MGEEISVIELFAGVGGFRIALEGDKNSMSSLSGYKKKLESSYKVIWSNQYEPSTKTQHASEVYKSHWPNKKLNGKYQSFHDDRDIEKVIEDDFDSIPLHDMLVGGFPCQDYSVATVLRNSKGLIGKKGVLWWSIYTILKRHGNKRAKYLILENVDRLLVSPANQRGRDFAVILSCLNELGYAVEWRVINASDYGMPQKRKRVFIVAYNKSSNLYSKDLLKEKENVILNSGILARSFPCKSLTNNLILPFEIESSFENITKNFNKNNKSRPFNNSGFMVDGMIYSTKVVANFKGTALYLKDILIDNESIPNEYFLTNNKLNNEIFKVQMDGSSKIITTELELWKYLKGSKKELKTNRKEGYTYKYAEGKMQFPDLLNDPSRTIITGEGGSAPSRFKHVVEWQGRLRRLVPIELEKLNMFPENHTLLKNQEILVSEQKRAFFMGNALVVGVVEKIAKEFSNRIKSKQKI